MEHRNLTIPTRYSYYLKFCLSELICILCPALPLQILQTIPSEYFSGFFTINEAVHNHYTRQIEHFHTHLAKSSQKARTLRCTGVKINNYLMNRLNHNCSDGVYKQKNLKEHILKNDISHLYGGTQHRSIKPKFVTPTAPS